MAEQKTLGTGGTGNGSSSNAAEKKGDWASYFMNRKEQLAARVATQKELHEETPLNMYANGGGNQPDESHGGQSQVIASNLQSPNVCEDAAIVDNQKDRGTKSAMEENTIQEPTRPAKDLFSTPSDGQNNEIPVDPSKLLPKRRSSLLVSDADFYMESLGDNDSLIDGFEL